MNVAVFGRGWWLGLMAGILCGGFAPAASAREPVVVVTVAGVERLLDDVDYLADLADHPEYAGSIRALQAFVNNLKGFDKSRPVSFVAFLPEGASPGADPEVALVVPVTNTEDLKKTIGMTGRISLKGGEGDQKFFLEGPNKKVPVHISGGWGVVSEKEDLVGEVASRANQWHEILGSSDAAIHLAWSRLPSKFVDEAVDKMARDANRDRERRAGENDVEFAMRQWGTDVALKTSERIVRDLDAVTFSFDINEKGKRLEAELNVIPKAGSRLAEQLTRLPAATQFAGQASRQDAFLFTMSMSSPRIVQDGVGKIIEKGRGEAEAKVKDEVHRGLLRRLLDVASDALGGNAFDGFVRVVPSTDHRLSVVAGTRCGRDGELSSLLTTVLPEAAKSSDVKALKVDALVMDDVRIHQIEPAKSRREDEKLFGSGASVFVGTGHGAIWGGVGGPQTLELLKETVVAPSPAVTAGASAAIGPTAPPSIMALVVHLKPWAGMIEHAGDQPQHVRSAIAGSLREAEADEVALRLHATPEGLKLRFTADDSGLRAVLAGIAAERESKAK